MKQSRIDWRKVKIKMAERGVGSVMALADAAGLHRNTLYKDHSFNSTVMDRLANFFGCDPWEIVSFSEPEAAEPVALPLPPARPDRKGIRIGEPGRGRGKT